MMRLHKPRSSGPTQEDPWSGDLLSRQQIAESLSLLLEHTISPLAISLDADYGSGKTYFLTRLVLTLKNDGYNTLLFNAWETDHAGDPFIAFVAAIAEQIENRKDEPSTGEKAARFVKTAGRLALRYGGSIALRAATGGLVGSTTMFDNPVFEVKTDDAVNELVESIAPQLVEHYQKTHKSIGEFKESLLAAHGTITHQAAKNKIVVIIDELDRCRPNYAISLLETIKHFFDVPGYIFILATNMTQLSASVSAVYGGDFDGRDYLRRFFDYELRLPMPDYLNFAKMLLAGAELVDYVGGDEIVQAIASVWALSCTIHCITPRDQERLLSVFDLAVRTSTLDKHFFPAMAAILLQAFSGVALAKDKPYHAQISDNAIGHSNPKTDLERSVVSWVMMAHLSISGGKAHCYSWDVVDHLKRSDPDGLQTALETSYGLYRRIYTSLSEPRNRAADDILLHLDKVQSLADLGRQKIVKGSAP